MPSITLTDSLHKQSLEFEVWGLESVVRTLVACVMAEELLNVIMNDGSRWFGELPQNVLWYDLRDHIEKLDDAAVTDFITDNVIQAWIDFAYRGYRFSVNDQFGDYIGSSLIIRNALTIFSKQFCLIVSYCLELKSTDVDNSHHLLKTPPN